MRILTYLVIAVCIALAYLAGGPDGLACIAFPQTDRAERSGGVVLLTGAATGIGRDAVEGIAQAGFIVVAGVRKQKDFDTLKTIPNVFPVVFESTKVEDCDNALAYAAKLAKEKKTRFMGIIANAGMNLPIEPFEWTSEEAFRQLMDVNLFATGRLVHKALPYMRESHGRIIVISSLSSRLPLYGAAPYSCSKGAVDALMDSIRREVFGTDIAVSVVLPGFVASALFEDYHSLAMNLISKNKTNAGYEGLVDLYVKYQPSQLFESMAWHPSTSTTPDILHALTSRYPRTRYFPGSFLEFPARIASVAAHMLPSRVIDVYSRAWFIQELELRLKSWVDKSFARYEAFVKKMAK